MVPRLLKRCKDTLNTGKVQRGGAKKRGGGKTSQGDPPWKAVSDPPHLGTFCPPPPYSISLSKSLTNSQNFPQLASSESTFGGLEKWFPTGHPREVLFCGTFCPPPFGSAQEQKAPKLKEEGELTLKMSCSRFEFQGPVGSRGVP